MPQLTALFYTFGRTVPLGSEGKGREACLCSDIILRPVNLQRWDLQACLMICYCWKEDLSFCSPLLPVLSSLTSTSMVQLLLQVLVLVPPLMSWFSSLRQQKAGLGCGYFVCICLFDWTRQTFAVIFILYLSWNHLDIHITKRQSLSWKTWDILEINRILLCV